jgi:hypothetical protein
VLILALAALLGGCAGVQEAWIDSAGKMFGDGPRATLNLRCDAMQPTAGQSVPLAVHPIAPHPSPVAGVLLRARYDDIPTPVLVAGPAPHEVLARDIGAIVSRVGFAPAGNLSDPRLAMAVAMVHLEFSITAARVTELQHTVEGRAEVLAVLSRGSEPVWRDRFEGRTEMKAVYVSAGEAEKALNRAYCQALAGFERAARGHAR